MSKMKKIAMPFVSLLLLLTLGGCDNVSISSSDSSISFSSSKKIIVTFDTAGGTQVEPQQLDPGDVVTEPTGVEKDGYVIDGWFSDGVEWDFYTPVYEDMTLVANWVSDTSVVNFILDGGSMSVTSATYRYGESIVLPVPTKEGYVFTGWFYGDEPVSDGPWSIHGDVTLLATWAKEKISLTYFDGEKQVGNQVVEYGKPFALLNYSSMGVGIRGWTIDDVVVPLSGESWDYSIDDAILTPAWADKTYSLSVLGLEEDEYSCPTSFDIQVGKENRLPVPIADAQIDCGSFVGWFLDGKRVSNENGLVPADWFPESDESVLEGVFGTPIENAEEFDAIRENLDGFYFLTSDIDLGGTEWTPIGTEEDPFTGCLVGFGHEIRNFKITQPTSYAALFAFCLSASFHDFTISDGVFRLDAPLGEDMYCATLCAVANDSPFSRIVSAESNVIDVNLRAGKGYVAGIAAFGGSGYKNCVNHCHISLSSSSSDGNYAFGIAAFGQPIFTNCVNYGAVTLTTSLSSDNRAGGISDGGAINCVNYGAVTLTMQSSSNGNYACGIGYSSVNCVNYGAVTLTSPSSSDYYIDNYACGIAYGSSDNCVNYGTVTSDTRAYGIGKTVLPQFTNCVNYGAVTSARYACGIGYCDDYGDPATFVNCVNYAVVTSTDYTNYSYACGIGCGNNDGTTFTKCANYGAVVSALYAYGIGYCDDYGDPATFVNCVNYAATTSSYGSALGIGLGFKFSYCINIGDLTGNSVGLCSPEDSLVSLSSVLNCCHMTGTKEYGALVVGEVSDYDCFNSYYSYTHGEGSGERVNISIGSVMGLQYLDGTFLQDRMSFDPDVWNLEGVDFEASSYPSLKGKPFEDLEKLKEDTIEIETVFGILEGWLVEEA